MRTYPPFALLAACFSLLLGCTYETPAESPADVNQPAPWIRYANPEFSIDFPHQPSFSENTEAGLTTYSIATLHNDTLLHLSYTDHAQDIEPALAYYTASTIPGVYNIQTITISSRTALSYSHIAQSTISFVVLLVSGKRLYTLSAASKRVIDKDAWAQFKQSFHVETTLPEKT